ncbi:MAG: hypothetical protein J4G18_18175, partial [Anaerolineae bacterium]|nr:hypothetical protein [Anaerolineae bacterium]
GVAAAARAQHCRAQRNVFDIFFKEQSHFCPPRLAPPPPGGISFYFGGYCNIGSAKADPYRVQNMAKL